MTDVSPLVNAPHAAEEGLARAANNCSAHIEQALRLIETVDKNLRQKRERIEEIQAEHESLALQHTRLGKSLDSASTELTQHFAAILSDVGSEVGSDVGSEAGNDLGFAEPLAEDAPAPATASNGFKEILTKRR